MTMVVLFNIGMAGTFPACHTCRSEPTHPATGHPQKDRMQNSFMNRIREATRLTRLGRLGDATRAIQAALNPNKGTRQAPPAETSSSEKNNAGLHTPATLDAEPITPGSNVYEVPSHAADASSAFAHEAHVDTRTTPLDTRQRVEPSAPPSGPGEFVHGDYTRKADRLRYKLYIPPQGEHATPHRALPLVVMLHGCKQDPDDFAAGTDMNERAREQGFFVLYPAQGAGANPSRCWNWFMRNHQQRDSGEPALIAGATRALIAEHNIDPRRVYVAGLSAGGAMAAIVAQRYPDIFAAAGVHSGLAPGVAANVMEGLAAMKNGRAHKKPMFTTGTNAQSAESPASGGGTVPVIVFHGDQDRTVNSRNGEEVIASVLNASSTDTTVRVEQSEHSTNEHRRGYTRTTHQDDRGHTFAEHWVVHGAGHAWSGGNAEGSYTDAQGPDATGEMLRFFFEHPNLRIDGAVGEGNLDS